jgi:hypothetical protein
MAFEHVEHHRRLGDIERGDAFLGAQGLVLFQGLLGVGVRVRAQLLIANGIKYKTQQ